MGKMSKNKEGWRSLVDTKDEKGISLLVSYSQEMKTFKVDVGFGSKTLTEEFNARHEPLFGMDVADRAEAMDIAEELAKKIETEFKL